MHTQSSKQAKEAAKSDTEHAALNFRHIGIPVCDAQVL